MQPRIAARLPFRALALLLAALLLPTAAAAADLQVYLVRHAEKAADDPRDPTLSDAGAARAKALAEALRHAGLDAVYATQYRRTQLTAAPAAATHGLEVVIRAASGEATADAAAFAKQLRASHSDGGVLLVVGHSNTIPALAAALLGDDVAVLPMPEDEFDRLMLVTLPDMEGTAPRLLVARYGRSHHPPPTP